MGGLKYLMGFDTMEDTMEHALGRLQTLSETIHIVFLINLHSTNIFYIQIVPTGVPTQNLTVNWIIKQ